MRRISYLIHKVHSVCFCPENGFVNLLEGGFHRETLINPNPVKRRQNQTFIGVGVGVLNQQTSLERPWLWDHPCPCFKKVQQLLQHATSWTKSQNAQCVDDWHWRHHETFVVAPFIVLFVVAPFTDLFERELPSHAQTVLHPFLWVLTLAYATCLGCILVEFL